MTVEVLRPVPFAALELAAEVVRPGRRVSLATPRRDGETELCRASGWRIRQEEGALPGLPDPEPPPAPGPDAIEDPSPAMPPSPSPGCTEQRWVRATGVSGRGTCGCGSAPARRRRAACAVPAACSLGDFGNGISAVVPWDGHLFVNTDLTLYLEREPEGEWLCLDAPTRLEPRAPASPRASSRTPAARVGRALQSLYAASPPCPSAASSSTT